MPVDFYPQKSLEELTTILAGLQNRQLKGSITEVNVAGVRTVRAPGNGQSRVETEILRVLYSLHLRAKGSDQAEKWPNPYASRIRRTLPSYVGPAYS